MGLFSCVSFSPRSRCAERGGGGRGRTGWEKGEGEAVIGRRSSFNEFGRICLGGGLREGGTVDVERTDFFLAPGTHRIVLGFRI